MKVYILRDLDEQDGIEGVYATQELAYQALDKLRKQYRYRKYHIDTYEVQNEIESALDRADFQRKVQKELDKYGVRKDDSHNTIREQTQRKD